MDLLLIILFISICIICKKSKEYFSDNKYYYNRYFKKDGYNDSFRDNIKEDKSNTGFTVESLSNDCVSLTKDLIRKHEQNEDISGLMKKVNSICKGQNNYVDKMLIQNKNYL